MLSTNQEASSESGVSPHPLIQLAMAIQERHRPKRSRTGVQVDSRPPFQVDKHPYRSSTPRRNDSMQHIIA